MAIKGIYCFLGGVGALLWQEPCAMALWPRHYPAACTHYKLRLVLLVLSVMTHHSLMMTQADMPENLI